MNLGFEIKRSRLLKKAGNVTRPPQTRPFPIKAAGSLAPERTAGT